MRRENRRAMNGEENEFKKILYVAGSILAVVIIGFVITFFVYGNKINENTSLAKFNTMIVDDYVENTEEASSSFGKNVNEMSDEITNEVTSENEINDSNERK